MYTRRVHNSGRINLPDELCEKFSIKKDDVIQISHDSEHILIKKHQPEYVCVITGKITDKGIKIGNAFISLDGLKEIQNAMKKKE